MTAQSSDEKMKMDERIKKGIAQGKTLPPKDARTKKKKRKAEKMERAIERSAMFDAERRESMLEEKAERRLDSLSDRIPD